MKFNFETRGFTFLVLFVVSGSLFPSLVLGQSRWVRIVSGEPSIFIDSTTIVKTDKLESEWRFKGWTQIIFTKNRPLPGAGKVYRSSKTLAEFDCRNQKYKYIKILFYDLSLNVVDTFDPSYPDFEDVVPDTIAEATVKGACTWARKNGVLNDNR